MASLLTGLRAWISEVVSATDVSELRGQLSVLSHLYVAAQFLLEFRGSALVARQLDIVEEPSPA